MMKILTVAQYWILMVGSVDGFSSSSSTPALRFDGKLQQQQQPFGVVFGTRSRNSRTTSMVFASSSSSNIDPEDDVSNENEKKENRNQEEKGDEEEQQNEQEDAAERWKKQAQDLRDQVQQLEDTLPSPEERRKQSEKNNGISEDVDTVLEAQLQEFASRNQKKKKNNDAPVSALDGKRVLVVGSNGRLGSMVCRRLLRQYPELAEVIAMVHVVPGENSRTQRGYGRLSYEVGAEDGRGTLNPAWTMDDNQAYFEYDEDVMADYNLQKLRVVECELLDPVQCTTIVDNSQADVIVWCASDFNGNVPRALSGGTGPLSSLPFLFRAVASPEKGRVEIEGMYNIVGALKIMKQNRKRTQQLFAENTVAVNRNDDAATVVADADDDNATTNEAPSLVDFVLASVSPDAFGDFETPFGRFLDIKRQGEDMIPDKFPSLDYTVLRFAQFDDNFVQEDLELKLGLVENEPPRIQSEPPSQQQVEQQSYSSNRNGIAQFLQLDNVGAIPPSTQQQPTAATTAASPPQGRSVVRRINRRDAARAVTDALVDPDFRQKKVEIWTSEVG